ncbi:MAG: hypothetical protein WC763_00580 [Candidatus Paceibacterota bacterium]|jgi:hypothetical protein
MSIQENLDFRIGNQGKEETSPDKACPSATDDLKGKGLTLFNEIVDVATQARLIPRFACKRDPFGEALEVAICDRYREIRDLPPFEGLEETEILHKAKRLAGKISARRKNMRMMGASWASAKNRAAAIKAGDISKGFPPRFCPPPRRPQAS